LEKGQSVPINEFANRGVPVGERFQTKWSV